MIEDQAELKLKNLKQGIHLVDTFYMNRPEYTGCYIVEDGSEIAIIETNTNFAVAGILKGIENLGWDRQQVKYVIVTHIHLDHAGGAGLLVRSLPQAQLLVHPRGFKHMVNPQKLIASAKQVYGQEQYQQLYGEIIAVPETRAKSVEDGEKIHLGHRELVFYDTPGHARHHHIIHDPRSQSIFSGDAFGLAYPRFRKDDIQLVFPSTSPTQFEPDKALGSFKRIKELKPSRVLLTHFGAVETIDSAWCQLIDWVNFSVDIADQRYQQGLRGHDLTWQLELDIWAHFEKQMQKIYPQRLTAQDQEFLQLDAAINAQGLTHFLEKKAAS